ncbi:hypothetical protein Mapa_000269 [Marchantia paleacea]|nr:hypothetical protein Mapa_000269 [Marchantia paleacea]
MALKFVCVVAVCALFFAVTSQPVLVQAQCPGEVWFLQLSLVLRCKEVKMGLTNCFPPSQCQAIQDSCCNQVQALQDTNEIAGVEFNGQDCLCSTLENASFEIFNNVNKVCGAQC